VENMQVLVEYELQILKAIL